MVNKEITKDITDLEDVMSYSSYSFGSQDYMDDSTENPILFNDIKKYFDKTDFADTSIKVARHYLGDGKHKIFLNYFDEDSQCEIKDDFNFKAWNNKENLHTFLDLTIDTFNRQKEYSKQQIQKLNDKADDITTQSKSSVRKNK